MRASAMPVIDMLAHICLESPIDIEPRARIGKLLQRRFLLVHSLTHIEPWRTLLAQNTIGVLPPSIPIFVAQGLSDKTVDPPVTMAYVSKLCDAGSRVDTHYLPDVGHGTIAMKSALAAVGWIADRFAGRASENDCLARRTIH